MLLIHLENLKAFVDDSDYNISDIGRKCLVASGGGDLSWGSIIYFHSSLRAECSPNYFFSFILLVLN